MALMKLTTFPNPILFKKTQPFESIGPKEKVLVQDMIETMYYERGVGLAANQVGLSKRLFVASADGVHGQELVFFNAEIIKKSGKLREPEGCLSVPETYEHVTRYKEVTLRGMNLKGEWETVEAKGLLARIFQHEIDHLDGKLFVHRLGWLKSRKTIKHLCNRYGHPPA